MKDVSNETKKSSNKDGIYEDTATWNPFKGCRFDCVYCIPSFQKQAKRQKNNCEECHDYFPHMHPERLNPEKIPDEKIIFVCGDSDVSFCRPDDFAGILGVMGKDEKQGRIWFLQSKDPEYFEQFLQYLPENTILLTTLETNRDAYYSNVSHAPPPSHRYQAFKALDYSNKIVAIEPIMPFDLEIFANWIIDIDPLAVFIGYNNHPKAVKLPEPNMEKTLDLIVALKNKGIRVFTKNLRKMAYRDLYLNKIVSGRKRSEIKETKTLVVKYGRRLSEKN